jgi:DNA-binding transcriptional LysR family regulator
MGSARAGQLHPQGHRPALIQHGLPPPEAAVESPSFHTSLSIVAATDLVGIAPMSAVRRYESLGLVRRLSPAAEVAPGKVAFLALRESLALPSVMALRDALLPTHAKRGGGA